MKSVSTYKVLLIEDTEPDALLVAAMLSRAKGVRYELTHVRSLQEGLQILRATRYDVVITDLCLPDCAGITAVKRLQAYQEDLPIVVLSASDDEDMVTEVVREGAQDYLIKGQGDSVLIARAIRHAIERKQVDMRVAQLSHYDSLTGLANRTLFQNRLEHGISRAQRAGTQLAIMFIDLDRFKAVNDTLGHESGDALLVAVAERLRSCAREADTIARLGGDEFTVILENLPTIESAAAVANKILNAMTQPFEINGLSLFVTPSIGITVFPHDDVRAGELLKNADTAMYKAKEQGRNNFQFYRADMNSRSVERFELEHKLRLALERQEFVLHYQPKIDVGSGVVIGVEALIRWQRGTDGLIPPGKFIPIAEETGLIVPIGEWAMREAAAQLRRWEQAGFCGLTVAVNLSARQFRQADLAAVIAGVIDAEGIEAAQIEFEITETLLMENTQSSSATLAELKSKGIRISVDDFGTGYSSLSYLKRFPIDALKIDQSFVRDITTDADDAAIASAIIALAHHLRLKVVAEGVETQGQFDFLREKGCDQAQGYLFSRPVSAAELAKFLRERSLRHMVPRPVRLSRAWPPHKDVVVHTKKRDVALESAALPRP